MLANITTQAVAELRLAAGDPVWVSLKATDKDTDRDPSPPGEARPVAGSFQSAGHG